MLIQLKLTAHWHLVDVDLMSNLYMHPMQPDLNIVVLSYTGSSW